MYTECQSTIMLSAGIYLIPTLFTYNADFFVLVAYYRVLISKKWAGSITDPHTKKLI